jgi:Tfp pilus assembly protein PilF
LDGPKGPSYEAEKERIAMLDTIARYGRRAVAGALLLVFCGCQTWADMKARFSPARPSPMSAESESLPPLTSAQKLDMQMAVGRSYESEGKLDDAIAIYADVLKRDSKRVDACHRLAIIYDLKGQPEKSRSYYQQALKLAPKNAELYCDFGYSCYLQRNWAEGEANFRKALELNPEFARAHINLGLLLARNYHTSQALGEFAKAGLDEAASRSNLALALAQEERFAESRQQYEQALAADPKSQSAKLGLAAVRAKSQPRAQAQLPPAQSQLSPPQQVQALPPIPAQPPPPVQAQTAPPVQAQVSAVPQVQNLPPVETQTPPAMQTQMPSFAQAQVPPPVQAQLPSPEQVQPLPPAQAPAPPEDEIAPMPPTISRPPIQTAYRAPEEISPDTRRL